MEAQSEASSPSQMDPIRKRLMKCGVPNENLEQLQPGLAAYVKHNGSKLQSVVSALLPGVDEVNGVTSSSKIKNQFRESIKWVQWLMFEEPQAVLDELRKQTAGTQGVCGAVWGNNDIAYRCRTCEHDPTCAICVPCFKAGNHVNHDYSMIHTGGGCCDCGDETAWKSEGFCSRHRGPGQVQPLPPKYAKFAGPVLGALLAEWKERLLAAERVAEGKPKKWDAQKVEEKVAYKTTSVIVEMLLSFCECSESLLNFVATLVCSSQYGLLDVLLRSEQFLHKKVVAELHELLFKLLGEPNFKYEFAKAFIRHYPTLMSAVIGEGADGNNASAKYSDYPILSNFSVQIFTVPTLTPRLVTEVNLLDMLLGNLKRLFVSSAGEDGRLLASKGPILNQGYVRLVEDIRYVMSHLEVAKYVARERPDLSKTWIQLLAFMQGVDPQTRVTNIHVEEENEHWLPLFFLEFQMAPIHSLYVTGAASVDNVKWIKNKIPVSEKEDSDDDRDVVRHAKIGRLSEESSVIRMIGRSSGSDHEMEEAYPDSTSIFQISDTFPVPYALSWLIFECIKIMDSWLGADITKDIRKSKSTSTESSGSSLIRKPLHWRGRGGRGLIRNMHSPTSVEPAPRTDADTNAGRGMLRELLRRGRRIASYSEPEADEDRTGRTLLMASDHLHAVSEINSGMASNEDLGELCSDVEMESLGVLQLEEWPMISYDVSRQDISFHIPLHRMISLSLHKAMELYTAELDLSELKGRNLAASYSGSCHEFFRQLLKDCHPCGFSAFVMEHPLRLKVFSAQVRAGMWRRNGHSTFSLCEYYRSVRWCEDSLELDLFLLQCCAAMAPPEQFVLRVLERFGLSDYLSLHLVRPNEYEPMLAQEMLALIIRIVAERGFCGLSPKETLKKELIRKLSVGDATHSQLLKALPPRLSDSKDLQNTLDTIAIYAHPSGMQQGKYSLRNDYWRELDLYHPRWSSRDLQVAEERYSRFCKASAVAVQLPRWRKPFYPLENISQIATSKEVLQIIRAVVFYAAFSESSSESRAPDGVLFTALHLLALGLDICSSNTSKSTDIENDEISLHRNKMSTQSEQIETALMDITSSNDQQQPPPLLVYANEVVYVGGIDRPEVSNHQSLLSLLVWLMKKYESGSDQCIDAEPNHCNIAVLICNLLEKFAELHRGCMHEIEKLAPSILHHLLRRTGNYSGGSGAGNPEMPSHPSDVEKKKALARKRQAAIMEKMKAAQAKFVATLDSTGNLEQNVSEVKQRSPAESSEAAMPVLCALCRESGCESPTALLTLVQKSRLLSFAESGPPSWELRPQKSENNSVPIERPEANESALDSGSGEMISTTDLWLLIQNALDGVNSDGPQEVEGLIEIIRTQLPVNARTADRHIVSDDSDVNLPASGDNIEDDFVIIDENDIGKDTSSIMIGSCSESPAVAIKEMATGSNDTISTVLAEYVAAISRLMSNQQQAAENHSEAPRRSSTLNFRASAFDGFGPNDCDGIHVSSCGHAVHHECLDRYLSSLRQRYKSRIIFEGVHIVDPDQGEFLCPVCRRLANSVLPVLPHGPAADMYSEHVSPVKPHMLSSEESILASSSDWQSLQLQQALYLLQNAEELSGKRGYRKTVSWQFSESTKVAFEALFHKLCTMYFPGKGIVKPASGRINQSLIFWDVFRYSLLSAELAARSSKSDAIARSSGAGLEALYKAVNCSEDSVLSLLMQAAEATQSQNRLTVLLRARGMQLLVGSISCCASRDALSENSLTENISSLLEHVDQGKDFPDIQFWKRTADPVLVHDPFSSFIWLLFCLPRSLPKAAEPFICLVHLFYLVCLVQALAYAGRSISPESDFSSGSCSFIKSILTAVSGTVLNRSSLEIDDANLLSCPTAVVLRRLTLPYLRRCALLYKLLNPSSAHLQEAGSQESLTVHMADDYVQSGDEVLVELEELQQLEKLFQIPCLETILEDKNVHGLALRWCQHLSKETGSRSYRHVVRCLPARPFELMHLPHIYQDLLQCYIKECCPACKSVPEQPALCLLCGTLCCAPSRHACCSQNECYRHAMTCGAGVGVFLMIRKTNILLQRSARHAPWPSPYLDAFGEEDYDMTRGKPLYLSKERYTALTNMVVSHGLDHSSHVLLQTTRDTLFI